MDWQIRKDGVCVDPDEHPYSEESEYFTIRLYHGGHLTEFLSRTTYVDGQVNYVDFCDADRMSLEEIKAMCKQLGHNYPVMCFYLKPECDIHNGLVHIKSDAEIISMCSWVSKQKIIEVYCQKEVQGTDCSRREKQEAYEREQENEESGNETDSSNSNADYFTGDDEFCNDDDMLNSGARKIITEAELTGQLGSSLQVENNDLETGPSQVTQAEGAFDVTMNEAPPIQKDFRDNDSTSKAKIANVFPECQKLSKKKGLRQRIKVSARKVAPRKSKNQSGKVKESTRQKKNRNGGEGGSVVAENQFEELEKDLREDGLDSTHGSSDEDGCEPVITYIDFNAERDMRNPKFQLGMRFNDSSEFKEAIRNYSISNAKSVKLTTNERHRVRAKCEPPCEWVCYASIIKDSGTQDLVIKTLYDTHSGCQHAQKNRNITAKWLSVRYEERIRANPNMPVKALRQTVDEEYKSTISKVVGYRTRVLAVDRIKGNAQEQYKKIWEYCDELKRTHPNSTTAVEFTPFRVGSTNPRFMRLYCCLGPCKQGFQLCRPVIGLDGCHIKGTYPGQLLSAIGVDPNNGWWPIAWAVVEKEATIQWKWFLELLRNDLELGSGVHIIFISDQQKGLDRALSEVLPNADHRYCVQHMYRNFKKRHPGKVLKNMLWSIARSSNIETFKKAMDDLKEHDTDAYQWVENAPHPSHWCKAFFDPTTKCDMITNNLCESFNSHILEARDKPVISLMENVRELLMERIQRRRDSMLKYPHSTGPLIRRIIDDRLKDSFMWRPIFNGISGYQVRGPRAAQFTVDVRKKVCSCGLWEVSGIPCCHAIVALKHQGLDVFQIFDDCFKKELFVSVYDHVLNPINGMDLWPASLDGLELDPPAYVVQPGRPKKARKRDTDEGKNHGKKLRRYVTVHCRRCGSTGHNAATCKEPSVIGQNASQSAHGGSENPTPNPTVPESRPKKQNVRRRNTSKAQIEVPSEAPQSQPQVQSRVPPHSQEAVRRMNTLDSQPQGPPLRRSPRKRGQQPLTDAEKIRINVNCEWLGKPPPFSVGRWKKGSGSRGGAVGRGRGRPRKTN